VCQPRVSFTRQALRPFVAEVFLEVDKDHLSILYKEKKTRGLTVLRRWAIVSSVQSLNSSLIVFWIRESVAMSTAAVASSRTAEIMLIFDI
jgi:hypothetical protein